MKRHEAKILRGALRRLRRDGWTQSAFIDAEGRCCAVGAVNRNGRSDDPGSHEFVRDLLLLVVGRDIYAWNDAPGRTFEQVESAFETAIELAEMK